MMTYEEAREFMEEMSHSGICLGTDSVVTLLRELGNPQDKLRFVHIAGTNGKGSTLSFISNILKSAGYTVGRYSSPRVFAYEEFVQVNGENIEKDAFVRICSHMKETVERIDAKGLPHPSLFEIETAIGFLYFVEKKCDIVVLECGMGGRDDATNVVNDVLCHVIAPIGLDHMGFLGNTIEEIAEVKAGIVRNETPVCIGTQEDSVKEVFKKVCAVRNNELIMTDHAAITVYDDKRMDTDGTPMICFDYGNISDIRIHMVGRYQIMNACLAIDAAKSLNGQGLVVSDEAIKEGLSMAKWPGRFDTICYEPQVIVDGAHNPHGMVQLKNSLTYYFPGKKLVGIMGVLADKAYDEEVEMMAPLFEKIFTITPPENPRALEAEKLSAVIEKFDVPTEACETIEDAVRKAGDITGPDGIIIIFGSLSYIGQAVSAVKAARQ